MKQIYKNRLIMLAARLDEMSEEIGDCEPQTIVFFSESDQTGFEAKYYRWAFYECPFLFEEWDFRGESMILNPELKEEYYSLPDVPVHQLANRENGTVWSAMHFFGIDTEEKFLHLFGADAWAQSPSLYGGNVYPEPGKIQGTHIAANIRNYITKIES